ncbi:MAG TPA: hypothetical protein PKA27_17020 [Fimbriimonadaceae bacterium]|nr:hypothetical protein [Fimbriimonadaceae bacterium]
MILAPLLLTGTLSAEWIIHSEEDFRIKWTYEVSAKFDQESVTWTRKSLENTIDGEVIPLPPDQEAWQWTVAYRPGAHLDHGKRFIDSAERRLQRLVDFVRPPSAYQPGMSWTVEFPEIPVDLAPKSTATWTLGSFTKASEVIPFTVAFIEERRSNQMTAEGKGFLDPKTGYLSELALTAKNAPVPGGENSGATYKVLLKLAQRKPK